MKEYVYRKGPSDAVAASLVLLMAIILIGCGGFVQWWSPHKLRALIVFLPACILAGMFGWGAWMLLPFALGRPRLQVSTDAQDRILFRMLFERFAPIECDPKRDLIEIHRKQMAKESMFRFRNPSGRSFGVRPSEYSDSDDLAAQIITASGVNPWNERDKRAQPGATDNPDDAQ